MPPTDLTIRIATRGSPLALAQAKLALDECRSAFPGRRFELVIIRTSGDKLQTADLAKVEISKGLFTKELEAALLGNDADLAVHSLKDLPTELPAGLKLGAIGARADVRDVLLYRGRSSQPGSLAADWKPGHREARGFAPHLKVDKLPAGATIATGSTRRECQLKELRPDLRIAPIRGNVGTRLHKLAQTPEIDAIVLAAAGLERLQIKIHHSGQLEGPDVPDGLMASLLEPELVLPCAGQAALGFEIRKGDALMDEICLKLDHMNTRQCVLAERAFLSEIGGGCLAPVAVYGRIMGHQIRLRAVSYLDGTPRRGEALRPVQQAEELGRQLAQQLSQPAGAPATARRNKN